jgi:hypothetical protein
MMPHGSNHLIGDGPPWAKRRFQRGSLTEAHVEQDPGHRMAHSSVAKGRAGH